jgi:hypothetical protein
VAIVSSDARKRRELARQPILPPMRLVIVVAPRTVFAARGESLGARIDLRVAQEAAVVAIAARRAPRSLPPPPAGIFGSSAENGLRSFQVIC